MPRTFSDFRGICCVLLGALTGALIALPWTAAISGWRSLALVAICFLIGGFIGYRQRKSVLFFYFCLVAILGLAALASSNTASIFLD